MPTMEINMSPETLREAIASALELAAPLMADDSPLERFEDLFMAGRPAPPLGLHYDLDARAMRAESFIRASRRPIFVPFNFELPCPPGAAEAVARTHMLELASRVRLGTLQTVERALEARAQQRGL